MSDIMSIASSDDHVKEQSEPLLAANPSGPSRPMNPDMIYQPPPAPGSVSSGRRYRDDPAAVDDNDGDGGDGDGDDDGDGRHGRLKLKLSLISVLRFCTVVFSLTGIVFIIIIEPRTFTVIVLLLLLWFVLFWNLFNLLGPLVGGCCGAGTGDKTIKTEWHVNLGGCIIGFTGRYEPELAADDEEAADPIAQEPESPNKPVKATWLADLSYAIWLTVFTGLATATLVNHGEYSTPRDEANILGMAYTVM
jgi:hypothetical protein